MDTRTAPIVVGGGVAGSAAAIALARAGASPLLVERSTETGDAICGGFLSWQSLAALNRLGLSAARLGGQRVTRVRLFAGRDVVERRLPAPGMGLSRHALDSALIAEAAAAGADVQRGVSVRSLGSGLATTSDGRNLASSAIFVAHGKYGLHGRERIPSPNVAADPVVGLRLRLGASTAIETLVGDAVELFLFDGGYAGLVRQEDGTANLCLAVHKSRLSHAGGRPEQLIARWGEQNVFLGQRLSASAPAAPIDAIAAVPYGWRRRHGEPGLWQLGDQAACIPSLAGEGMGIALASAESAVAAWCRGENAQSWQNSFAGQIALPMTVARAAWHLAETPRWAAFALPMLRTAPVLLDWLARLTRVPA